MQSQETEILIAKKEDKANNKGGSPTAFDLFTVFSLLPLFLNI